MTGQRIFAMEDPTRSASGRFTHDWAANTKLPLWNPGLAEGADDEVVAADLDDGALQMKEHQIGAVPES
jgi:hypothetical protein